MGYGVRTENIMASIIMHVMKNYCFRLFIFFFLQLNPFHTHEHSTLGLLGELLSENFESNDARNIAEKEIHIHTFLNCFVVIR